MQVLTQFTEATMYNHVSIFATDPDIMTLTLYSNDNQTRVRPLRKRTSDQKKTFPGNDGLKVGD